MGAWEVAMLTDLEYKILQFVRDGLYGRSVSRYEIASTLNERMYSRYGNQHAQIIKTIDSLIARQFLERKIINNRERITLTPKGEQAWHAWFYKDDSDKTSIKEGSNKIINIWKNCSMKIKAVIVFIGGLILECLREIIVQWGTGKIGILIQTILALIQK